jgi:hypothetical protein
MTIKGVIKKALAVFGVDNPRDAWALTFKHHLLGLPYFWSGFPVSMQLGVNNFCGPRFNGIGPCSYCLPQSLVEDGKAGYHAMKAEWVDWVLKEVNRDGRGLLWWANFLMGDGLNGDVSELWRSMKRAAPWARTQTFTCGSNFARVPLLINRDLDWINFTFSAHNRELYKIVHRGDRFDSVLASMRYVADHRLPHQQVEIHYVVTEANLPYMGDWYSFVGSMFPDFKRVFSPLVVVDDNLPSVAACGSLTLEDMEGAIDKVSAQSKYWDHCSTGGSMPCVLWGTGSFDEYGTVMQCCTWTQRHRVWNYGFIEDYIREGRSLKSYWVERNSNKQRNIICRNCKLRHPEYLRRLNRIKVSVGVK